MNMSITLWFCHSLITVLKYICFDVKKKNQTNTEKIFTNNLKWTPHVFGKTIESWEMASANFTNRKTVLVIFVTLVIR